MSIECRRLTATRVHRAFDDYLIRTISRASTIKSYYIAMFYQILKMLIKFCCFHETKNELLKLIKN
jgi:hypothetical protein